MSDTHENGTGGKVEKLGLVPVAKINTVCPAKAWEAYVKSLAAPAQAKEAAATAKAAVLTAMVGKLKLTHPEQVGFYANSECVVLFRRPTEKKPRASALPDLTV